jgi:O-6-methylguanine DNA methyltransferase
MGENRMSVQVLNYSEMESPVGTLHLISAEGKLVGLGFGRWEEAEREVTAQLVRQFGRFTWRHNPAALREAQNQLDAYFAGKRRTFELELDLRGTPFQRKVWNELLRIPYGETRSYKQVAEAIGHPLAVRAVGMANHHNPVSIIVPCHRVIGSDGRLTGYGGGLHIKTYLLELEERVTA